MNPSGIDANGSVAHRSSGPPLKYFQRYGLAALSVGVALGASLLLDHFHFRVPSALLLLFAVAISSWYAGAGPAVLAAILSTISFYWYFVEPVRTIYINRSEIPYFVIFTAFAALLSRFGTFRQRAEADLRPTHDQLKIERPKLGSRIIALLYFAFSSCWILFTDRLVHRLGLSDTQLLKVSEAKGILFISLSTLLMYVLVEKALRQRHSLEAAYWQLVETAQEGVWSVDAEGKTVFANENMAAILGTSRGEMIGKSILPFVPREKKDELLNHLLQRERGLQEHYEFAFLRADGAQVWTLLRVSPVFRHGQHTGSLALVSDITERKRAEEALRRLNRELRAISDCNQTLLRATDEQSLLEKICRIVCEEAGYRMAWVAYAEHDEAKSVHRVAWMGAEEGYLASAGITWADTERGRGPTGTAIRSGKSCCVQDFATDPRLAPWREGLLQRGFRSGIALPLKDENDNAFGSLTIYSAQPNTFTPEEVRLLEELAGDLAFGIVTLRSGAARKRAEQALRQSEAYLAEAQRLTHTGSWALDVASGNYVYSSEEYLRISGFDPQQGLPTKDQPLQRIHRDDLDKFWQAFQKLIDEKVDSEGEYRIVLPDGTVKYVHAIRHPVLNANGEVVEVVGTTVDITERKRAEEALRRSEAYLSEAQRLTHTGAWATDAVPEPLYWSEELFRLYGLDPQQGFPTHDQAVQRVHPEDRDKYVQAFHRVIHQKVDSDVEFRTVLPDGTIRYLYGLGHPILNANGDVIEVVGTTVDITERKRAEEERTRLRQLEADLAHINRVSMMGELAASIAHEVNQPLSGVVSNASACLRWLAGEAPNMEEAREATRRIVRDGKRAGEVIARIRALTRKTEVPREKLDLNETIREVLALVGDQAKRNSVMIRTRFADDVFPVLGDQVRLQQVVLNLIMNGIEAMSSVGERARELVITTRNLDSEQVQVTVEDSGVGLDPNTITKIFDAFYTTKPGGMGMGLSISRSILQAHGGRLWATAKDGPGTVFHFTLPKYQEEESNARVAAV